MELLPFSSSLSLQLNACKGASKDRSVKMKNGDYKKVNFSVHDIKVYVEFRAIVPLIINLGRIYKLWPLYPREITQVATEWEAIWDPEPVWKFW